MRHKIFLILLLLSTLAAHGQFTLVSGTVHDSIGLPYAGGTITAVLNISGTPIFTATNLPYTPPTGLVQLDLNGNFQMQLATNSALTPGSSTWTFITCSTVGTVPGAWGTNSACFTVKNITITGSTQNISRQIQTQAQPLTYSASFVATDSPNCAKLAGPVDLDTTHLDATGQATVVASAVSSTVFKGIAVAIPGSGCLGYVQVATALVVPCVTDNTSTIGHFVTVSASVTGECTDAGAAPVNGSIGNVMRANTGVGTITMVLLALGGGGGGGGGGGNVLNGSQYQSVTYPNPGVTNTVGPGICTDDIATNVFSCPAFDVTGTGPWTINTTYGITPVISTAGNSSISVDPANGLYAESVNGGPYVDFATSATASPGCTSTAVQVNVSGAFGCASETDDNVTPVKGPHGYDVQTQGAYSMEVANNTTTGTTQNTMACDDGAGKIIICPHASSTTNIGFDTLAGAGITGTGVVSIYGFLPVFFDNPSAALDYAIGSTTTDGYLHDTGSTSPPTTGQPYYLIWTANSGSNTIGYIRVLTPEELNSAGTGGGGDQVQVNSAASKREANFNNTTPTPPTNGLNIAWQIASGGANKSNISGAIVGDGNPTHCLLGNGTFAACPGAGTTTITTHFGPQDCTTDQSGNTGYGPTNPAPTHAFIASWGFVPGTSGAVWCKVYIPHAMAGTPNAKVILKIYSADGVASHTANFQTCDVVGTTNYNVAAPSCAANQAYTTTATAYAVTSNTYNIQSTIAADDVLFIEIVSSTTGTQPTNNIYVDIWFEVDQSL